MYLGLSFRIVGFLKFFLLCLESLGPLFLLILFHIAILNFSNIWNVIILMTSFFFFGCTGSSLLLAGLLQSWAKAAVCWRTWAPHCVASLVVERGLWVLRLSCSSGCRVWAQYLQLMGSRAWAARAQLLHSTWDLPKPRIEPTSPALAGG